MKVISFQSTFILGLATAISLVLMLLSNPILMAHTFSENENALFLTLINKIKAETQLVSQDATNNTQQAHIHAKAALGLLAQDDPVVNTTWTSEISELNPRVTADLLKSLNDLRNSIGSSAASSSSSSNSNSNSIQSNVRNIDNILDEAATVRSSSNLVNNPKTQALVLANLGNEIYNNYAKALGIPESMGGMKMTVMATNNSSGSSGVMSGMNSMNGQAAMNQNNPSIKNMTAYQTAQSLASMAKEAFIKNFKPIAPSTATISTITIGKYIDQLKGDINKKASFATVMEAVHVKLHPTLISTYKLTTG